MIKVTLVGLGTVSKHLENVFENTANVKVTQVVSSRKEVLEEWAEVHREKDGNEISDIYIIAVSDDAISTVSEKFSDSKAMIVHTSGSVMMKALPKSVRKGVFYPLQTFSKGRKVDFKSIPICIEADRQEDLKLLRNLAQAISESVYEISSEQRKSLHLAAVYVNNFANHLFQIGHDLCEKNQVSFAILKPLIKETVAKIESHSPFQAQTGPARRDDQDTIASHLRQLENTTQRQVYQILTKSIQETHGKKL